MVCKTWHALQDAAFRPCWLCTAARTSSLLAAACRHVHIGDSHWGYLGTACHGSYHHTLT